MVTLKIDASELTRAILEKTEKVKNDLPANINRAAYSVAANAWKKTFVADRAVIREELKKTVTITDKKGRSRQVPLAAILAQRDQFKKTGKGFTRDQIGEAARKFINVRVSHRTFMQSGWISAMKTFAQKLGIPLKKKERKTKNPIGGGTTAKPGLTPAATVWNSALAQITENPKSLEDFAGKALQEAMNEEAVKMRQYIARKMQQIVDSGVKRLLR